MHGPEHGEYITVNEIIKDIDDFENVSKDDLLDLRELTKNYVVPEGACRAQTTLLNLMKKLDEKR